jgi:DNA modification methylase
MYVILQKYRTTIRTNLKKYTKHRGLISMYTTLEQNNNVIYPDAENATYRSQLNYSTDLKKPFQGWYRYKEGFSLDLVKRLIKENSTSETGLILDPFSGSGSTLLGANEIGFSSVGFEVNPFSYFLSKVKLTSYDESDIEQFKEIYPTILNRENTEFELPKLSFSDKVFNESVRKKLMTVKNNLVQMQTEINNEKVFDLLKLGWLACVEELSEYRKAGNGLKKRKLKNPRILEEEDVYYILDHHYSIMYRDIKNKEELGSNKVINDSCLNMREYISDNSVSGIIFSPPYANCFDYTEIYKLELWFGDFVSSYEELKVLRKNSLRSHLNANLKEEPERLYSLPELEEIITQLQSKNLWDKKIPTMIRLYFHDMFKVIENCYEVLDKNGFCNIIVSNSSYGGIVIPTDLLFAQFAKSIGFEVEKIEVDRFIITSSQQYEITRKDKKLLRESIVCLRK